MITQALRVITNNFEKGFYGSTLMAWSKNFDNQGRLLNADPNYRTGSARVEGKEYFFVRKGWIVRIWDKPVHYMAFMNDHKDYIGEVDLTPDYVLEREKNLLNGF